MGLVKQVKAMLVANLLPIKNSDALTSTLLTIVLIATRLSSLQSASAHILNI